MGRAGGWLFLFAAATSAGRAEKVWPVFDDVPAREIAVTAALPKVPRDDRLAQAFARPDRQLVLLVQEDTRVVARTSSDAGASFSAELELFGGAGQNRAAWHAASLSPAGVLYVAAVVFDPAGRLGLQVRRSNDLGRTWSAPSEVVRGTDDRTVEAYGIGRLAIAAGPTGRVAVVYSTDANGRPYARVSDDGGATWTAPVRVGAAVADPLPPTNAWLGAAVDAAGRVLVAFVEGRTGAADAVLFARSTDGGLTFSAEQRLSSSGRAPDLQVAADGTVLVAAARGAQVDAWRSTDGGASFTHRALALPEPTWSARVVRLAPAPSAATVLLAAAAADGARGQDTAGPLVVFRSADAGATYDAGQALTATASVAAAFALRRTPAGNWAVAFTDLRDADFAYVVSDVYVRVSRDDGRAWDPPQRADADFVGEASDLVGFDGLATPGADELFVAYLDGRGDGNRARNVYANRSAAVPLSLGFDARVDADGALAATVPVLDPDAAADGSGRVYAAFVAAATTGYPEVFVAASADGGYTYGNPRRVSTHAPSVRAAQHPRLAARAQGRVFALYFSDAPGVREVRVNRSPDGGATWAPTDVSLGVAPWPCGVPRLDCASRGTEDGQLALGPDQVVYGAWAGRDDIDFSRSTDDGASFSTTGLAYGLADELLAPVLCARQDRVVVAFAGRSLATGRLTVWAATSTDRGASFASPLRLASVDAADAQVPLACAAAPGSEMLVAWVDTRDGAGGPRAHANRWNGTSWGGDTLVAGPLASTATGVSAAYLSSTVALVGYDDGVAAYVARSTDGGATFPGYARVDSPGPDPAARSSEVRLVADGAGQAWVTWLDEAAGSAGTLAVRPTSDGATFGPVYRLNRNAPQGVERTPGYAVGSPLAAAAGVLFAAFAAERGACSPGVVVNAYDANDFDRDGAAAAADCNDRDPGARAVPGEAGPVTVQRTTSGPRIAWPSLAAAAGADTVYDVVTGHVADLRADRGYARAACLRADLATVSFDDGRGSLAGTAEWYLVRAHNVCGRGSYGNGTPLPDPRDALDAASPCP